MLAILDTQSIVLTHTYTHTVTQRIHCSSPNCPVSLLTYQQPSVRLPVTNLHYPVDAETVSLQDCFQMGFASNLNDHDEQIFKCSSCGVTNDIWSKSFEFNNISDIIIISFERFRISSNNKIRTVVDYPIQNLVLHQFCNFEKTATTSLLTPPSFNLFGVVRHHGIFRNSGHYTSYILDTTQNQWFSCDDSTVSVVPLEVIRGDGSECILCYRKQPT